MIFGLLHYLAPYASMSVAPKYSYNKAMNWAENAENGPTARNTYSHEYIKHSYTSYCVVKGVNRHGTMESQVISVQTIEYYTFTT